MKLHISSILGMMTGNLIDHEGLDGCYKSLSYMMGYDVMTHELGIGGKECAPTLSRQFPQFIPLMAPVKHFCKNLTEGREREQIDEYMEDLIDAYGAWHEVEPLPKNEDGRPNPVETLVKAGWNKGIDKILVVSGPNEQGIDDPNMDPFDDEPENPLE